MIKTSPAKPLFGIKLINHDIQFSFVKNIPGVIGVD